MKRYLFLVFLMLAVGITACEHKNLCINHSEHAHRYHVNIIADYRYDWEECMGGINWQEEWPEHYIPYYDLRPDDPSGLRVVNYNKEGDYNIHNIKAEGGVIMLYEGLNDLLFYNNDTEYIIFSRTGNGLTTRATTRTRTRATYLGSEYANEGEPTMSAPDMLYANFFENYLAEKVIEPADIEVTLQPLVFTYKVRYEFKSGLKYVAMARGALSGMAKEVLLNTGETSEEPATILYDCDVTDYGVRALVNSFGAPAFPHPNYPTRTENKHALNLEVVLRNGKMVTFDFDVTDQVKSQPHGGVIVVRDIEIDEEVAVEGSGAFDVEVDDWGPYEDVELPL
ncbi:MAG: DUF5119 domain-containing protein [Alistipes sp.]|nr:DUF5119 domain-containing protein [Alistipes sp.]